MKRISTFLIVSFLQLVFAPILPAGESDSPTQTNKIPVAVQSLDNKNGPALSPKWNFLKRTDGPSPDPVSNGLMSRLEEALAETGQFAVAKEGPNSEQEIPQRGLPQGEKTDEPVASPAIGALRFVVTGDIIFSGDQVTIVVRLFDSQTKRLIKATTVEGRPEDLQDILPSAISSRQSPEERAVRAAIERAVVSIREALLKSVTVKAFPTKIRQKPSLQSAPIATVRSGTVLPLVGQEEDWYEVRLENGETGWIPKELVK